MTAPGPRRAPEPPAGFRGAFRSDAASLRAVTGAAGPIRIRPAAVARPRDTDDLAHLVRWASGLGLPLFPRGAGTGMPGGNVGPDVCVDLSPWSAVGPVDAERRTVDVGPGAVAAEVDVAARAHGLHLPALPSSADHCTVGGMVANNAAGARSFRHGAIRAWVDAVDVVLADGARHALTRGDGPNATPAIEAARTAATAALGPGPGAWPRVRKNASGYALDHFLPHGDAVDLLVGSEGTLGLVTSIRLRLLPLPAERAVLLLTLPDLEALAPAVRAAREASASACEFFARRFLDLAGLRGRTDLSPRIAEAPALLLVEVAGTADEVGAGAGILRDAAAALDAPILEARGAAERAELWRIRHAASPVVAAAAADGRVSMQFVEDSVVHPDHLGAYLGSMEVLLNHEETDAVMFGHAGDGNVHLNPLIDVRRRDWRARARRILEGTVELVAELHGTLSGEHGDGRIRAPFHERIFGPSFARAFRAVKEALDPRAILNPGVVVAEPGQDPLAGLSPRPRVGR